MCRDFRDVFPIALCYLQLVPVDEVITMLLYYREDETLCRLMLEPTEKEELDRLWDELFYVSREPEESLVAFNQLIEYASQLEPERIKNITPLRPTIEQRLEDLHERQRTGRSVQLKAVVDWIGQAFRRDLTAEDRAPAAAASRAARRRGGARRGAETSHGTGIVLAKVSVPPRKGAVKRGNGAFSRRYRNFGEDNACAMRSLSASSCPTPSFEQL